MHVKYLEYAVYAPDGRSYRHEKVADPSWEQVEQAIRRLDKYCHPYVWLWASEDESKHAIDGSGELLEVMGGQGEYWLAGSFEGYYQRRLDYPERGDREIELWTSDQGFADAERHVCRDLEVVVRAARYYAECGGFDPSLRWGEGI